MLNRSFFKADNTPVVCFKESMLRLNSSVKEVLEMSEYKLKNWRILFSLIVFISICFNLGFNHNQIVNAESELNSLTVIKYLNNQEERPVNQVPSEPSTVQVDALFKAWKVSDGPMGMNEIEN